MADIIIKGLDELAAQLSVLIGEFEGALDLQDAGKRDGGLWGQLNANLSMNDFAHNWTVHRNDMVKAMKGLRDTAQQLDQAWDDGDRQMYDSIELR